MRALPAEFAQYRWATSTAELARRTGLDPVQIVRFDGNVPAQPHPSARPGAIARALADVNEYAHGGYPELLRAIASYTGVDPDQVVLGAGADDLILLCARTFAGPDEVVAIEPEPTYPLFRTAAACVASATNRTMRAIASGSVAVISSSATSATTATASNRPTRISPRPMK